MICLALLIPLAYAHSLEYGPVVIQQQQPQLKRQNTCQSQQLTLARSCQGSGFSGFASRAMGQSSDQIEKMMSECQVPAARLGCNLQSMDCSVVVVDRPASIAHVVFGVPYKLCQGLDELCVGRNRTTTTQQRSSATADCPIRPSTCTLRNSTSQEFTLLKSHVQFASARAACARIGMDLAQVTSSNFLSAVDTVLECAGTRKSAWVASWNGDDYGGNACLALTTGDGPGGGAINPRPCTSSFPVLCTARAEKTKMAVDCSGGGGKYKVVLGVSGNEAANACATINMTLAGIGPNNSEAVLDALQQCPMTANQTVYVSSFVLPGGGGVIKAAECGCLEAAVGASPSHLVAIRPLFECQCANDKRAALCTHGTTAVDSYDNDDNDDGDGGYDVRRQKRASVQQRRQTGSRRISNQRRNFRQENAQQATLLPTGYAVTVQ